MTNNNNFAGSNRVASAADNNNSNNNINNYQFFRMSGGHDFADLAGAVENMRGINGAIGVRGHEGIRIFVRRDEGMWTLTMFNTIGIGKVSHEEKYNLGQRMTSNMVKRIEDLVLAFIDTIADYETEQEQESIMERKYEQANEIIADAQESVNTIITDLELSIYSFDHIKTKIGAFAAKMMVQRVQEICNQCLIDCGEIFGCQMVEEDGFSPWVGNLEIWGNGHNMESLIDTLDYMISGDSDMPLGLDAEDMEFINEGGCYCFDGYPMYIWQDLREFVNTYYHYNYCA